MKFHKYEEEKPHFVKRILWRAVNKTIFRICCFGSMSPISRLILRLFGAKIGRSFVYGSSEIFAPWNLEIGNGCCVGPNTILYNKGKIILKDRCTLSQRATLCSASHDITDLGRALVTAPIILESMSWVASDAFVGMGVTIGEGAVVGARAAVFKDVEPWSVVGGNPAKFIKKRVMRDE